MRPLIVALAWVCLLCEPAAADTVHERFPPPAGFTSVVVEAGSFGASLQALPLMPPGTPVKTFSGGLAHAPWAKAVVDLSVGERDLQQCADSAIRLRAGWLRQTGKTSALSFHATSGDVIPYARYAAGERAFAKGRGLAWRSGAATAATAGDDAVFAAWLETVFLYAGSLSLAKDTVAVTGPIAPGDLLVLGGSPGHVLVVMDVARSTDGRERWLIGQGFMPAQSFHVIGWVAPDADGALTVPSWSKPFPTSSRRRFKVQ